MAKKKTAKRKAAPKKTAKDKQPFLNKELRKAKVDEELEKVAEEYEVAKETRMAATTEEVEKKTALLDSMRAKKLKRYDCQTVTDLTGARVRIVVKPAGDETVALERIKESVEK